MHPGPNTKKSTANQPWWHCGHHLVGTLWSILKKPTTHDLRLSKKNLFQQKERSPFHRFIAAYFFKEKKTTRTGFPKKSSSKKCESSAAFQKNFFQQYTRSPPQQQHMRRLIVFFVQEKKTPRLSKKILF